MITQTNCTGSGLLVVLSGPSGVGKDTVIKKILEKAPRLRLSVSTTTRVPRKGEVHGRDYYFVSKDKFQNMVRNFEFLEYAQYCGNYYGTSVSEVSDITQQGNDVILEIEVQGGAQVKEKVKDAVGIFICPPSISSLRDRIAKRGLDSDEAVALRVQEAYNELTQSCKYDYIVVNDFVDRCADNIIKIIDSEHMKTKNMQYIIDGVLKNE